MNHLLYKRLFAFFIDYAFIIVYAFSLYLLTHFFDVTNLQLSPFEGQFIGFITLTFPVFMYFYLMEQRHSITYGKKLLKFRISKVIVSKEKNIFLRNVLKFLPWEIAHTGVHWVVYFSRTNQEPPFWVFILLIFPQIVVVGYMFSVIFTKGQRSLYDLCSNTKMELVNQK